MSKDESNLKLKKNLKLLKDLKIPELAETAICILTVLGATAALSIDAKGRVMLNDQVITTATDTGVGFGAAPSNTDCGGSGGTKPW
jgi:hypothetical protein